MTPATAGQIQRLIERLRAGTHKLVLDADTHVTDLGSLDAAQRARYDSGPDYYHGRPISAEHLLAEMDMAGVDMALIWQNPAATAYTEDPEHNTKALLAANRYIRAAADRWPDRFIPAGWVDPQGCGGANALAMAGTLVEEYGFAVVKMNPAQNRYPIDSPQVLAVAGRIVELGAVPAFHFGADTPFTPAAGLGRVAERFPERPILAIHMGGGGAGYLEAEALYREARALGLAHRNLRFVFSAKRDTHIESDLVAYQLAGDPFCRHLFCGSDAPYGRVSWNFGGFRAMFATLMDSARHPDPRIREHPGLFTPEVAQNYLGGNFARFLVESHERLLAAGQARAVVCS